tara:strand:- start:1316 stop:1984 length:669 start_codon:yes stop_codon:yes gene_type:complete
MFPFPFSFIVDAADIPVKQIANAEAISFNGTDSYIDAGDFSSIIGEKVSISMWFRTTSTFSSNEDLLSFGLQTTGSVSTQRVFFDTSGVLVASINNGAGGYATTSWSVLNDGNWHHLVCTWEGGTVTNGIKIYVDGSLASQATSTSSLTSAVQFIIGENLHYNSNFDGDIDEVGVFNTVLSADKITQIYDATAVVGGVPQTANLFTGGLSSSLVYWNRMGDS